MKRRTTRQNTSKVVHGNNLPRGLSPLEQVRLAVTASKLPQELAIPEELLHNIHWFFGQPMEATQDEVRLDEQAHREMVDAFRSKVVSDWHAQVERLHHTTIAWMANSPSQISAAVQQWKGPFVDYLIQTSGHADLHLVRDLQQGFTMMGNIPAYGISAKPKAKIEDIGPAVNEVWAHRGFNNNNNNEILQSLSEDANINEIWDTVAEEVAYGASVMRGGVETR